MDYPPSDTPSALPGPPPMGPIGASGRPVGLPHHQGPEPLGPEELHVNPFASSSIGPALTPSFPPPPGPADYPHDQQPYAPQQPYAGPGGPAGPTYPPQMTAAGGSTSFQAQPQLAPGTAANVSNPFASGAGIRSVKTAAEFSLREYAVLLKRRRPDDRAAEDRLHAQHDVVLSDLRTLRKEIGVLVKAAEANRWRRWLVGGLVASFIPAIKRIFRRSSSADVDKKDAANSTEYAYARSKSLIGRILDHTTGTSGFATVAFFVLAVLYVFQNEVSLRVARTVSKRLKRLSAKIQGGDDVLSDKDMDVLKGWRWRVLLMGK